MSHHVNRLLADLGTQLGLENLTLDENGHCCLTFDDLAVHFESTDEAGATLVLYAPLGLVPDNAPAALYAQLLQANYFFTGTGGGTLGLSEDGSTVTLVQLLAATQMTVQTLEAALQNFVNAAELWSQHLLTEGRAQLSVSPADLGSPMLSGMIRG